MRRRRRPPSTLRLPWRLIPSPSPVTMGTGEGSEDGYGWVDASAGTIVWVRRRNGSWWPGRILGPEELPATHLGVSPRSGTPVKLLGREDASVDWYNLEKSKRVKAFRCGEFDDCIERAEASIGAPIKKREKYARREDAILHALELEKQQKQEEISNCLSNNPGDQRRETYFSSDISLRDDEPRVQSEHSKNKPETMFNAVFPFKEENVGGALYDYNGESAKGFSSEDDIPEAMPPMKGLLDFGSSSKRKGVNWDPSNGHTMEGTSYDDSSQNFILAKMKISSGGLPGISLGKKRDRRRPLAQVLQSSAKLSLPPSFHYDQETGFINMERETDRMGAVKRTENSSTVHSPARSDDFLDDLGYPPEQMPSMPTQFGLDSFTDESSRVIELNESDSFEKYCLESDTENVASFFTDTDSLEHGLKVSGRDTHCDVVPYQLPDRLGNINTDERALTSHIREFPFHKQAALFPSELGFSKWHMKGKRNVRNLAKRPMGPVDGTKTFSGVNRSDGFSEAIAYDNKLSSSNMREVSPFSHYSTGCGFYNKRGEFGLDVDLIGNNYLTGHDGQRDSPMLRAGKYHEKNYNSFHGSVGDSHWISPSGWEGDKPSHMFRRAYWMESEDCFEPVYADHLSELEPMLVDVDLKVQATSYQRERVPLVSLMSRLNGNAIVGHPVQVEILENGRNDASWEESPAPPSFWRTARRTAMQRVPRSNLLMSTLGGGNAEYLRRLDIKDKTLIKKPHRARFATNSHSNTQQLISGKFQKHLSKRGSVSCQKNRELSSVATRHELGGENIHVEHSKNGCVVSGLIKPEDGMVPLVTCVPFKVVFSRILEAVARPSSTVIR